MKILHINAVYKTGSTGRIVYELGEVLSKHGVTTLVATTKTPKACRDGENVFIVGNRWQWKLHGLLSRIFGTQAYFSHLGTQRLLRRIRKERPDIVHLHNLHANYIHFPMLMKFLIKHQLPVVVTLHDCWYFTGKCCHYTVDGCYKWLDACHDCPSLKKYNSSWFFDRTAKMYADKKRLFSAIENLHVVGVSRWLTEEARRAPVFKMAKRIDCIYNWVDTKAFAPKDATALRVALGLIDKKVILCVASGWSDVKGFHTILSLAEHTGANECVVALGCTEKQRELAKGRLVCLPRTESIEELALAYSMADVLFQPSLEESFGLTVAEAMACGTPVVCFRSTANPELVCDEVGKVADGFTIDAAWASLREVMAKGKAACTDACRARVLELFEKEKNTGAYYALYRDIVNEDSAVAQDTENTEGGC